MLFINNVFNLKAEVYYVMKIDDFGTLCLELYLTLVATILIYKKTHILFGPPKSCPTDKFLQLIFAASLIPSGFFVLAIRRF